MVCLSSEGEAHVGASAGIRRGSTKTREFCTREEIQRAERLGSAWLQRYRHIEGSSLLPSVDPLNELLLGLDFFADLREEGFRPLPCKSLAGDSRRTSVDSQDPSEESGENDDEHNDEVDVEKHEGAKEKPQGDIAAEANTQGTLYQEREYLRPIPTVIPNESVYIGFFLPLFLQEAKQALARAIKLDLGPPEEFVQQSGEPRGSFLSLLLSRSGGMAAASSLGCRYCHGDLVLMYIPASRVANEAETQTAQHNGGEGEAQEDSEKKDTSAKASSEEPADEAERRPSTSRVANEAETQTAQHNGGEGEAQEDSGKKDTSAKASSEEPADEAERRPSTRTLRPRDTDCHVLAVVSQGQHEAINVKVLTPLGPAYNGKDMQEGSQTSAVYNPATGRPYGFLLPRDRLRLLKLVKALNAQFTRVQEGSQTSAVYNPATGRPYGFLLPRDRLRLLKLVKALNAQFTKWTVQRIMSLTTLHREFQGLMSLPDLLLKDSLFRVPAEGSSRLKLSKANLSGPLHNPLLEGQEGVQQETGEETAVVLPPTGTAASGECTSSGGPRSQTPLASTADEASENASERQTEEKPLQEERRLVIPEALRARLESLYNASQLAALEDSLKVEGVTLIQGPPGTGKTSTIVGVVSVILHAQLQGQHESSSHSLSSEQGAKEETTDKQDATAQGAAVSQSKWRPWLQPNYSAWMDADELTLEDLDCQTMLQPAAVPTDPPICLARERHELQPVRILVCAPSNAAIDEIVKRLTADPESGGGIFDASGRRFSPAVVRVGPNVHPDLLQHSLQYKALQRLRARGSTNFAALAAAKADVLRDSVIVCATISVCGSNDLTSLADCFDTVVVDEASQAVELATLIPLRLGCRRLILVGDPKQLPATIFSRHAIQLRYDRSLFQRLEGAGQPTNMLSQQYRMHPAISRFASVAFYEGLLRDAPHLPSGLWTPFPSWHRLPILQPIVFFNLDSEHTEEHTSLVNYTEADFVRQLIDFLRRLLVSVKRQLAMFVVVLFPPQFVASGNAKWEHRIAVISPYAQQVVLLRRTIKAMLGIPEGKSCPVDVNTVDGFQGQEKDFIIFSAVRGIRSDKEEAKNGTVGFLGDMRRLNVAVTRGRVNLWLVGNGCFLRRDKTWARLYAYAKARQALISINRRSAQHSAILTKWILKYCKTHHRERKLLEEHAPRFLTDLSEILKAMRERKQRRGAKEDEEQGDELQTEGPISWEQPIEDPGAEEEGAETGDMTTFHDVADEGCLDEVAVHMRDEALKSAVEAEAAPAPVKANSAPQPTGKNETGA
ncbi:tRNA-splicing endonuclease positive effector protein, putative [Eimeria praecox]|uniref:tRNA-splicing endonuclease positive effector protein, putative n=1 Tax=Eimeria praecox TaxID=51316 RepID=U6G5B6_9EIME|nr:tRNA-splicing endonuclease positive effector protein, putative [Eimeria praecox]